MRTEALDNTSALVDIRGGEVRLETRVVCFKPPWAPGPTQTLLLYNGNSRSMDIWLPWIPILAPQYRVVCFNPRGIGRSTRPASGSAYDAQVLVDDAMALLDALGIDAVHWIGESSGGVLGLVAALQQPARLRSLVLLNTPFKFPKAVGAAYLLGEPTFADTIAKHGVASWARQTLGFRLDLEKASPALQDWLVEHMGRVPPQVMVDHFQLSIDADLVELASRIAMPLLNLVGEHSPLAERSQMEEVQRLLPNAELELVEGYGHGINLVAADFCSARVRKFLDRVAR